MFQANTWHFTCSLLGSKLEAPVVLSDDYGWQGKSNPFPQQIPKGAHKMTGHHGMS